MPLDQPCRCVPNPNHGVPGVVTLNAAGFRRARAAITTWPGYAPTPLASLPAVAAQAGVAAVHIKDESARFGLGSFKALGGAYAVLGVLRAELARRGDSPNATAAALESRAIDASMITVTCATDGNHGRSVAWGAQRFGAACTIFVHETVSPHRADAIAAYGATIRRVPGTYDDSVRAAAAAAEAEGWHVVSDTSWPGYTEIPREIMQGYRLMPDEALDQLPQPPTHVFIQAGVGGVAAAVALHLRARVQPMPAVIVVEPDLAACLMLSAEAGRPVTAPGALDTIMAGLACGEPSLLAWQELDRSAAAFMAIPDQAAIDAMRRLATHGITAGESGAAGLAALLRAAADPATRAALRLQPDSRILLFNTEGATDPALYKSLVA
jgi:diaminopropionate ammonia-lyase